MGEDNPFYYYLLSHVFNILKMLNTVCHWDLIECDSEDDTIVTIDLTGAGLEGTIPSSLGYLPKLKDLILSGVSVCFL